MNLGIGDMSVHLILKQYLPQQEGDSQNVSSRLTSDFRADKASGIFGLWEYFVGRSVNSLLV
ncbi:MAG: hypothetical protein NT070_02405 [Cyanobacteria bacterium]|nr:hypothetical protein [Cyanobacteriota bacterium]